MSRASKHLGLLAICGPFVFLFHLVAFLVNHKPLILLLVFVLVIKKVGIKSVLRQFFQPFILVISFVISKFFPHYDRCGIGFRKLHDNNYDAIKLDSVSVAPLDETDIHAFRNTPAYKKMQAANKMNPIKQYASY